MLDGIHTGANSPLHALLAVRMYRHGKAVVFRGFHHRFHFVLHKLRVLATLGHTQHTAGSGDLDQVGAVLIALAHRFAGAGNTVNHPIGGARAAHQVVPVAIGGVRMATGGGDGFTGGVHPRADDIAAVDGIAQADRHIAAVAEVAHRGKASH